MPDAIPIAVRGDVDDRAVEQLRRCAQAGGAIAGVLCADAHVGYSQPIGGAVAYPDHISPSGVGYDIGCIAEGERVLTADGCHVAIEDLVPTSRPTRPSGMGTMSPVRPYLGILEKGDRSVVTVTLADGRTLRLTPDHELRTRRGWVRADALGTADTVLCPTFTGLPYEPLQGPTGVFLRLAGYVNGDGHIPSSRRSASVYTAIPSDAASIALAVEEASGGYRPPTYVRTRPNGSLEAHVRINRRELVEELVEFGCPTGRKRDRWDERLLANLLSLPAWARAQYLAGFAGAGATTPAYASRPLNLTIKQAGGSAMRILATLFESLGFRWAVTVSDGMHVGQLQGGVDEQLRFLRDVGFAFAAGKSRAAAHVAGRALSASLVRREREAARRQMRRLCDGGVTVRDAVARVAADTGLTPAACIHLRYREGRIRVPRGWGAVADVLGECSWVPVRSVEPAGRARTYDVVTGDPEAAFVASGMTVHNCGNKAVRTDLPVSDLGPDLGRVMDTIVERISFGVGRANDEPVDHPVLDRIRTADFAPQRRLHHLAAAQLGTVGAGNHYVDLFAGDDGHVWVGVHFGSRGFGHRTASGFLALAAGQAFDERGPEGEMDSPPVLLHVGSELGQAYLAAMELAGEYAYAGRDVVVDRVLEILGARALHSVHNHHNFAWRERHLDTDVWVIRKGCTPAFPGQEGFVGATMGEPSVILRGTDAPAGAELLHSTVHGAGRVMSRRQAAGRIGTRAECSHPGCRFWTTWSDFRRHRDRTGARTLCPKHPDAPMRKRRGPIKPGRIDFDAVRSALTADGVVLRGGAADEAPDVYKRLDAVLAAHGDTIDVLHRLTPIGVAMAPADTHDPYKD